MYRKSKDRLKKDSIDVESAWDLEGRKLLCPYRNHYLPEGYSYWTDDQLRQIRFVLIELVAHYKCREAGKSIMTCTLKTDILGIQSAFKNDCGYDLKLHEGSIFNCRKEGLMAIIDKNIRGLKSKGFQTDSHNVLSKDDLMKLFRSDFLSK